MLNTFEFILENKWIFVITLALAVIGQLQQEKVISHVQFKMIWQINFMVIDESIRKLFKTN